MTDIKIRILVVDDMASMRKFITKICRDIGLEDVTEAKDGEMAWEAICSATPSFDLVISDWCMPKSSGMDLLKRIRSNEEHYNLPFVCLSAVAEQSMILDAKLAGVDHYIVKPFTVDYMNEKLMEIYRSLTSGKTEKMNMSA